MQSVPEGRHIGEAVESAPAFELYSTEVVDEFGGVDWPFDSPPWYTAKLPDERVVVTESEET